MAWVCKNCSTNNEDSDEACFVCGEKKPAICEEPVAPPEAPPYISAYKPESEKKNTPERYTPYPTVTRSYFKPKKKRRGIKIELDDDGWTRLLSLIFTILACVIGTIISWTVYNKTGEIFILSRILKAFGVDRFHPESFLVITTILAFICSVVLYIEWFKFIELAFARYIWIEVIAFCVTVLICPSLSSIIWAVIAIVNYVAYDNVEYEKAAVIITVVVGVLTVIAIAGWVIIGQDGEKAYAVGAEYVHSRLFLQGVTGQ